MSQRCATAALRCYGLAAPSHTTPLILFPINQTAVRVDHLLSLKTNSMTHSTSPRAQTSPPHYILAASVRCHSLFQDYHASFFPYFLLFPSLPKFPRLPSVALGNLVHDQSTSAKGHLKMFYLKRPASTIRRASPATPPCHHVIQQHAQSVPSHRTRTL
jgi:hypothetical protein